jgi:4-amino-4-deoxy-L-arabinose transferase-like glycosyltransferase
MRDQPSQPLPDLLFAGFLILHVAVWTLVPLLCVGNIQLDVIEALAWGREWQAGYYKHPPLSAWLVEIFRIGPAHWPLFLLSQAMVAAAFVAAWMLARDILPPWRALIGVTALTAVQYHTISSIEFNPNVVQYPFWAIAALAFWKGVRRGGTGWWILLGLACAAGILGKHSFVLLPASMGAFMLLHLEGRRALATPGPWLALTACIVLLIPHLIWNLNYDFPTLEYAAERGGAGSRGFGATLASLGGFLATQMLALVPIVVLLLLAGPPHPRFSRPTRDGWLLITIGLGPALGFIATSLLFGIGLRDMWGAPLFLLSGPLLMLFLSPEPLMRKRFAVGFAVFLTFGASGYALATLAGPKLTGKWERAHFPGRDLATEIGSAWRARHDVPLKVVIGDVWLAGNVSFYDPQTPSVYIDADPEKALWLDDEQVRERGAVVIWMSDKRGTRAIPLADSPHAALPQRFPDIEEMAPLALHARWLGGSAPVSVGWAIIPPQGAAAGPEVPGRAEPDTPR